MKQPRSSTSQTNTKPTKRALLPTFRQSKTSTKVQQVLGPNKSQIYFDTKVIPLEIFADRKQGESLKITVNSNDIVIQDGPKVSKTPLNISSSTDLNAPKEWIQLNLGEIFHTVKVKKIGDENVFGICSSMISWENSNNIEKKISTNINVKEILKSQIKLNAQAISLNSQTIQSDKTKQMKAFVANLMSKKINRRSTEKHQITANKFSYRKKSDLLENKISRQFQNPSSSTISNTINGISIPRSFRRDPLQRNLKQSKITKSEKETSVGEQSLFINQKLQSNLTHISSAQNEDYDKKKQKFDSQPYFYQKSTITSQFSSKNEQASHKSINISRQQKPSTQLYDVKVGQKSQNIQSLDNKSEHLSQQEVQQDIKRSALIQQSSKNQDDQFIKQDSKKNGKKPQQSSQCFQSKQVQSRKLIQSSGTIYQSKYQ